MENNKGKITKNQTEDKSGIMYNPKTNSYLYLDKNNLPTPENIKEYLNYHLYLIDENSNVELGDYIEYDNKIGRYVYDVINNTHDIECLDGSCFPFLSNKYFKKIIATTSEKIALPGISEEFIISYCEKGGIRDVNYKYSKLDISSKEYLKKAYETFEIKYGYDPRDTDDKLIDNYLSECDDYWLINYIEITSHDQPYDITVKIHKNDCQNVEILFDQKTSNKNLIMENNSGETLNLQITPKDFLKNGYLVKLRNGDNYLVLMNIDTQRIKDIFILITTKNKFHHLGSSYDDNLININHPDFPDFDIQEIYKPYDTVNLCNADTKQCELIWKRNRGKTRIVSRLIKNNFLG